MEILKVSSKSNPNSVAGALANTFKERNSVEIQTIGAGAVNQAIKAIAIARGFISTKCKKKICNPSFTLKKILGVLKTSIKIIFLNK